ncbi:MAG: hypothetical protein ABIQ44_05650 [Chloroflexia bacterium]
MKPWLKILLVTLLVGIPTIPLGQLIWQVAPDPMNMGPSPSGAQLAFMIGVSAFEGLGFGLGVAFLVFGYPMVQRLANGSKPLALATQLSITWWLVSWWPHDNLHRTMGSDYTSLIAIEYGFHVTLLLSAAVVAYTFVSVLPRLAQEPNSTTATTNVAGIESRFSI